MITHLLTSLKTLVSLSESCNSMPSTSKADLIKVKALNEEIIKLLSDRDALHETYSKLQMYLTESIDTYEQFAVNPYKSTASQAKYNSDNELGLGEYNKYNKGCDK